MTEHDSRPTTIDRRTLIRGVAVGGAALPLLAACGGGGDTSSSAAPSSTSASASQSAGGSSPGSASASAGASKSAGGGSAGGTSVAAADVPVGGGTILTAAKVVVTQPTKGTYKAFSAICTHQGCPVTAITGGQIVCPCHGSHFSISDGSPLSGPASSPLPAKKVSVAGGKISVT